MDHFPKSPPMEGLLKISEDIASRILTVLAEHPGATERAILRAVKGRKQMKAAVLRLLVNERTVLRIKADHQKLPHRYFVLVSSALKSAQYAQDAGSRPQTRSPYGIETKNTQNRLKSLLLSHVQTGRCRQTMGNEPRFSFVNYKVSA